MRYDLTDIKWYKVNPKDGSELVLVPGGWFWMGSDNGERHAWKAEKPRHLHHVEPFYFGVFCVTVAQFRTFVRETSHAVGFDLQKDPDEHPVRFVNWQDATAYCQWAGLRLPTEAEWELAARGYRALKYPWGNDWEDGRRVCCNRQRGPNWNTEPVFAHPAGVNRIGGFQQSGNLWEWCADAYDGNACARYALGDFSVPSESGSRVLCGGSWREDYSQDFCNSIRDSRYRKPDDLFDDAGFRAAGTVTF
jgi:formylglycine-generating enzyme